MGWALVWLRTALTSLFFNTPPIGYLFQWNREFSYASYMTNLYKVIIFYHVVTVELWFCSRDVNLGQLLCGVSWPIFQSVIPSCQHNFHYHIKYIGPLLMLVWEGLHWLLARRSFSYQLRQTALRADLESHPSPIFIIDRSPYAQNQSISWVFDWVVFLLFDYRSLLNTIHKC